MWLWKLSQKWDFGLKLDKQQRKIKRKKKRWWWGAIVLLWLLRFSGCCRLYPCNYEKICVIQRVRACRRLCSSNDVRSVLLKMGACWWSCHPTHDKICEASRWALSINSTAKSHIHRLIIEISYSRNAPDQRTTTRWGSPVRLWLHAVNEKRARSQPYAP